MNSSRVLGAAAVLALVLPLVTPTASSAQRAHPGGGGVPIAGGGGGRMGGGFSGGGAGIPSRGASFAASPAMRGGGSFAGAQVTRGPGPSFSAGRVATVAPSGTWNRGGTWNGGRWHHRHGGFWPGVAAGAAIGALGSYAYYGSDPYYYGDPYYYNDGYYDDSATVAVGPDVGGDSAAYCAQRFRSFDPASGTYLGYDGLRHPCP